MEPLIIEKTIRTPGIHFKPDGSLTLEGRSIPLNPASFFSPIIKWVKEISVPEVQFIIKLEYINTCSTKYLLVILQLLKNNPTIKSLNIIWYYEIDDERIYEMGIEFESLINTPFSFLELVN